MSSKAYTNTPYFCRHHKTCTENAKILSKCKAVKCNFLTICALSRALSSSWYLFVKVSVSISVLFLYLHVNFYRMLCASFLRVVVVIVFWTFRNEDTVPPFADFPFISALAHTHTHTRFQCIFVCSYKYPNVWVFLLLLLSTINRQIYLNLNLRFPMVTTEFQSKGAIPTILTIHIYTV